MRFPYGITVTVRRRSVDRFGDWTTVSTHQVRGCAFAPRGGVGGRGTSELTDRRDTTINDATLYTPYDADLTSTDQVVFPDGSVWEIEGVINRWASPFTGWKPGAEVWIRQVEG